MPSLFQLCTALHRWLYLEKDSTTDPHIIGTFIFCVLPLLVSTPFNIFQRVQNDRMHIEFLYMFASFFITPPQKKGEKKKNTKIQSFCIHFERIEAKCDHFLPGLIVSPSLHRVIFTFALFAFSYTVASFYLSFPRAFNISALIFRPFSMYMCCCCCCCCLYNAAEGDES